MPEFVTKSRISSQRTAIWSQKFIKWFLGGIFASIENRVLTIKLKYK